MKENKPYTLDDLAIATADYRTLKAEEDKFLGQARAAQSQADSHQRQADKAHEAVERARNELRKILSNLEKV